MKELTRYIQARGAARMIGVSHITFRRWHFEGKAPEPDIIVNGHPAWKVETIETLIADMKEEELEKEREQ